MKTFWITLGTILGIIALFVGGYLITVAVSGPKGVGDAIIQKNSAENWTAAQARFEELYADIVATDRKIDVAAELLATNPNDKTYQQTLAGTKSYCEEIVGDYNAEARKFKAEEWRSPDLPPQIDTYNPATDCKENI